MSLSPRYRCSIVVPVRDEARCLPETVPSLWQAAARHAARIVWVCNGCTDASADVIRSLTNGAAEILELPGGGKTAALQAGDTLLGGLFPRFYIDADIRVTSEALGRMLASLESGMDLVAATMVFDTSAASRPSAAIARCWSALPYARTAAYQQAVGLSARGRAFWDRWPDIIGDDIFMSAMVASTRREILADAVVTTRPPATFAGWVRMRARWQQGELQLQEIGLSHAPTPGQRSALAMRLLDPRTAIGAWLFLGARLLSGQKRARRQRTGWLPERGQAKIILTSRSQ